jgi:hypothetical protein
MRLCPGNFRFELKVAIALSDPKWGLQRHRPQRIPALRGQVLVQHHWLRAPTLARLTVLVCVG